MTRAVIALLLVTACSVPQTSETKEDSVAVLSQDTIQVMSDEVTSADTIYNQLKLAGKFTESQIDFNVNYVYEVNGLDVYTSPEEEGLEKIGHIDYKSKVTILRDLDLFGVVEIDFEGKKGYINGEYLLWLPVPETEDVVEYFTKNLMLIKDPVERKNATDLDNTDGMFSYTDYIFEGCFKIHSGSQYESGFSEVTLPGMDIEKAYLFASYFYESFGKAFEDFPTMPRDEDLSEQRHVTVRVEGEQVTSITVGNGEGCYWEDSLSVEEGSCTMSTSGGC